MNRGHEVGNPEFQTARRGNSKSQIPNPKQISITKAPKAKPNRGPAATFRSLGFGALDLFETWDLVFGISNRARVLVGVSFLCLSLSCHVEKAHDSRWTRIDTVVQEEIAAGHLPGAVVFVGQADRILYWRAFGRAVAEPFETPMQEDTIFDLASLTKPIATAPAILILIDQGRLDPNDRVGRYLPAFACNGKEDVRIWHLLTHTSGLPAYTDAKALKDFYGSPCADQVIEKICSLKAQSEPGQQFRYSCLGYITLARIVQVVTGQSVAEFTQANLFGPLGMKHTRYAPPSAWQKEIAGTEIVEGALLRGTVHDPLARLMDGVSGNAGLFSTAPDLALYCRMLLHGGTWQGRQILSPAAVTLLTAPQSHGRAYGFDLSSSYSWIKGPHASPAAFCHSGYTGTSLVCDPATGTYLILLTNSVHPHDKGTTKPLRQKLAEIVFPAPGGPGQS
jgi:CubicO group peptidase (beta-lactamase class C family)